MGNSKNEYRHRETRDYAARKRRSALQREPSRVLRLEDCGLPKKGWGLKTGAIARRATRTRNSAIREKVDYRYRCIPIYSLLGMLVVACFLESSRLRSSLPEPPSLVLRWSTEWEALHEPQAFRSNISRRIFVPPALDSLRPARLKQCEEGPTARGAPLLLDHFNVASVVAYPSIPSSRRRTIIASESPAFRSKLCEDDPAARGAIRFSYDSSRAPFDSGPGHDRDMPGPTFPHVQTSIESLFQILFSID
ncbi:hypothetical protein B0H11DRAFT_1941548 [Mycena galericulata]|nr:hypothetical protein B0H11DRAFT_1941548 [Mycena galericulata]